MTEPVEPKAEEESKEANEEEKKEEPTEEEKKEEPTEEANEESKEANEEEEKKEENRYASLIKEITELAKDSETNKRQSLFESKNGSHIDYVPQFRVLMQLEQLVGIAEKSPLINSLLQDFLHPSKIQNLIELAAQAHP